MVIKLLSKLKDYKGELVYSFSSVFRPVVRLASSFVVAAFVDPEKFGIIQSVALIATYFTFLNLGVFSGLNRNLAFYKAQNRPEKVLRMVTSSFWVSKIVGAIGLLTGLIILLYFWLKDYDLIYLLSAMSLSIVLFLTPQNIHFDTTFRSGREFKTLGIILVIQNSIFGIANIMTIVFGYFGKIAADILNSVSGYFLRERRQPIRPQGPANKKETVELVKVGLPLLIGGYLLSLFNVTDQSIIATQLGSEALGYYTISKLVLLAIPVIPVTLSTMLYPRASAQYGRTKSNKGLQAFYFKALGFNLLVVTPLCILIYFLLPWVVTSFTPKYLPGLESARINLLTCLTFVSIGPSIIIGVVRRNTPYIIFTGVMLVLFWMVGVYVANRMQSIESVAYLRFAFSSVLALFSLIYSFYLTTLKDYRE